MEVAVKPKEASGPLKCAYCHGDDGEVKPCLGNCGSYRHDECKTESKKCPTLGCIYGTPIDQIKTPPPEIIELAKRMGVSPSELWPPKQALLSTAGPRLRDDLETLGVLPPINPTSPGAFFEGLDRMAAAHHANLEQAAARHTSAFHTLLDHTQQILNSRLPQPPSGLYGNPVMIKAARDFAEVPWPDELRREISGSVDDIRAEVGALRDTIHKDVVSAMNELRQELPKAARPAPPAAPPSPVVSDLPSYVCKICSGYGLVSVPHSTGPENCDNCNGYGVVAVPTDADEGVIVAEVYKQIRQDKRWPLTVGEAIDLAHAEQSGENPVVALRRILKNRLWLRQHVVVGVALALTAVGTGAWLQAGIGAALGVFVVGMTIAFLLGWKLQPRV